MFYLSFGFILMLAGACMMIFKWIPYQSYLTKQLVNRYKKQVDERHLCLVEGASRLGLGALSFLSGYLFFDDSRALPLFIVLSICWALAYYSIRNKILKLK